MSTTFTSAAALLDYQAGFFAHLVALGYSKSAAKKHRALLVDLAGWAVGQGIAFEDLPRTDCEALFGRRRAQGRRNLRTPRSLVPLFDYLIKTGVVASASRAVPTDPVDIFAERYLVFLTTERGLCEGTARMYARVARQLAAERVVDNRVVWSDLDAADVSGFVARTCDGHGVSWARQVVSAVRCVLRYLRFENLSEVDLDQAVLSVASLSPPPPAGITATEVAALLSSGDRTSVIGRRDFAILVMLCRLGPRGSEVIGLTLDDIDWRAGEIVVTGKGGRRDRLPLLAEVGEALVDYLQHRPRVGDRAVFLRVCAPIVTARRDRLDPFISLPCLHPCRHRVTCTRTAFATPLPPTCSAPEFRCATSDRFLDTAASRPPRPAHAMALHSGAGRSAHVRVATTSLAAASGNGRDDRGSALDNRAAGR